MGPGDGGVLLAAGQLVQTLLATRELVAVLRRHGADLHLLRQCHLCVICVSSVFHLCVICVSSVKASPTYIPDSDLIHDLREHLGAGLREGPVQLAGGVDGVPGTDEGSDKTVIRPVS